MSPPTTRVIAAGVQQVTWKVRISSTVAAQDAGRVADAVVPVGMVAVERLHVGAIGPGLRLRAHLPQPIEPQAAHPLHVGLGEARAGQQIGEQRHRPRRMTGQRGQRDHRRVGPDLDVEVGADAGERIGQPRPVEIAGAVVEQIGGKRRQPGPVRRIGRRPAGHQGHARHHRDGVVRHDPDVEAAVERRADDAREMERPRGARCGKA